MAKRVKMRLSDMDSAGIYYHNFHRVRRADGLTGWRYVLDQPLTADQIQQLKQWRNVSTGSAVHRYAPEIKYTTLIIWDKCLPGEVTA